MRVKPVLLYDGNCALCRACVRGLRRAAQHRAVTLRCEPLQGPAAQAYLREQGLPAADFDSVLWVFNNERGTANEPIAADAENAASTAAPVYALRTEALIAALKHCGGAAALIGRSLRCVPQPLRDLAYRAVARARRWLG